MPPAWMLTVLAAGTVVLCAWIILRLVRPRKFWLDRVPGRPGTLNIFHVAVVFLISQVAVFLAIQAIAPAMGISITRQTSQPSQPSSQPGLDSIEGMRALLPAQLLGQLVLIGGCLAVAGMTMRGGVTRGLGLSGRRWPLDLGRAAVGLLAILPVVTALLAGVDLVIRHFQLPQSNTHQVLLLLIDPTQPVSLKVFAVFMAVGVAPVAEELLFRGLLQTALRRLGLSPWLAILIASALFAASHGPNLYGAWPALFSLSVALGYNYERTGRLTAPVLMHGLFNAVNVAAELSA